MKNIQYLLMLTATLLFSCDDDFLDRAPKDKLSEASVWSDFQLAEAYTNGLYVGLPNGFARGYTMLSATTDEANMSYTWSPSEPMNNGSFSSADAPDFWFNWDPNARRLWYSQYDYIRQCNLLLENIEEVPGDQADKDRLVGEAKFLRAFFYHDLVKFYGGVPLVKETQTLDVSAQVPRSTYEESVNFIVQELDEAAALLPDEPYSGRVVQASAVALKGRVLLHAERWAEAAAASQQAIEYGYTLHPNYQELFTEAGRYNSEVMFDNQHMPEQRLHAVDLYNFPNSFGGWGATNPTQNFVEMYEMEDGESISTSPLYDADNPYERRDPRFYASIVHDASLLAGDTIYTRAGGINGILGGGGRGANTTGYFLRKFLNESNSQSFNNRGYTGNSANNWIFLRLGEVLLNYAEAQNEAVGPDDSVYEAVNQVRARAGMPPLAVGLGQAAMREKIRHERAIELAFEEHRYHDLRRWGLGVEVLGAPVFGIRISEDGSTFERFEVEDRVFEPKHNLLPIPQSDILKNPNLEQNPGW